MAVCDGRQVCHCGSLSINYWPIRSRQRPRHGTKGKSPPVPGGAAREGAVWNLDFRLAVRYKHPA
jgi:hypothetical protein